MEKVLVSKDRLAVKFVLAGGEEVIARCDADCCSYTWIEGVELPSLPAKVISVEDIEMPYATPPGGKNGPGDPDSVEFYGLRVITDRGHLVIPHCSSSPKQHISVRQWSAQHSEKSSDADRLTRE